MKPLAYSYEIDQAGLIRAGLVHEVGSTVGRFDLGGIWPGRSAVMQAPRSDQRDLLRVAAAVAAADRLSPRWSAGGTETRHQVRWQRELHLEIAVERPERWEPAAASAAEALAFLTGDHWHLQFTSVHNPCVQEWLLPQPIDPSSEVALFSGGLDSAAGLLARHLQGNAVFLAVSISGTSVREAAQRTAIRHLQREGARVRWVAVGHQLQLEDGRRSPVELSRRTRGFLFLAVGAVAANILAAKRLFVYESGIGALNIRTTTSQVGAETTRAVHPGTLFLMERLLSHVLDEPVSIELPFLFLTKREVCRSLGSKVVPLAKVTMSCDEGEGHKPDSMEHCGLCTSCLFRRVALHGAPDPTNYRCTPRGNHNAYDLAAFELQALEIRSWDQGFESLLNTDPETRHAVLYATSHGGAADKARAALVAAYERYAGEVAEFVRDVRPTVSPATPLLGREVQRALFTGTR